MNGGATARWCHADGREQTGRVRVSALGLDWQADGETTRQIDARRIGVVEVEGERLRVELRSREPGQPADVLVVDDVSLLAPLHELRTSRARPAAAASLAPADETVATRSTPPVGLLLLLAGFVLLAVGAWLLVGQLWRLVPDDVERLLGESGHAELVTDANRVEAPQLQAWLEDMLRELADEGSGSLQLDIIRDDDPNAFALPGGFIVVHTGLFRHAPSPEAVAGVLAHELVHVEQHHGLRQVIRSLGLWVGVSAVFGGGDLLVLGGSELIQLSHSRDAESEADALAAQKLQRAGRSVFGLIEFLRALEAEGRQLPGALDWLSTHPSGQDRIARLEQVLADERFTPRPWLEDRDAWDAAVARLLDGAPEDEPR